MDMLLLEAAAVAEEGVEALAEGTTTTASDVASTITSALSAQFDAQTLLTIFGAAIGAVAVFVIAWFGYRFISRKVSAALKKGRL